MTEAQFQRTVMKAARRLGWRVFHVHDSRREAGGALIGDVDAAGFPDLVLVHPRKRSVLYRELKSETGRISRQQLDWIETLHAAGEDVAVWRPSDWTSVETELRAA